MRIVYRVEAAWPPLAWLAECRSNSDTITVAHGSDVHTSPFGFCEAAWDAPFEDFDFDRANAFFGSGARLRDGRLLFVSSHSTMDRLHDIQTAHGWQVSNSLACLARAAGGRADPWYPWYYEDFHSISDGIDDYTSTLRLANGPVRITYWRNLAWDGRVLERVEKPLQTTGFDDFESYVGFLESTLSRLAANMASPSRAFPLSPVSTASSGYDALAVTVLARTIGTRDVICAVEDRSGYNDSAVPMVRQLGMEALAVSRNDWREALMDPVPFIVGDACGRETWIAPIDTRLSRRVLLTGCHGDRAWSAVARAPGRLARSSHLGAAGLSLCEYRLKAGFVHCPLPYFGIDAIQTIRGITNASALAPWRLGGHYDRPIPRRIIESAGIGREQFGQRKTATAVHPFRLAEFERFMAGTPAFVDFMRWLRRASREAPPPEKLPRPVSNAREIVQAPLFRHLFPWALERHSASFDGSPSDR